MSLRRDLVGYAACLALTACGGSEETPSDAPAAAAAFSPPPPAPGYTRIVAPVIAGIQPGGDVMQCQYVLEPFDRDMDVLDISGYQSSGGHHSIAYAMSTTAPLGTSRDCNTEDNTGIGGFLGGIGGEGGKATLPDGVVFRLAKGKNIMLNTHFLNTSKHPIDGHTVIDVKFSEVDTARKVASMFANVTTNFSLTPHVKSTTDATCMIPHDLSLLKFTNHMHTHGTTAVTTVTHADGSLETVHADDSWAGDLQFNPAWSAWPVAEPLVVKQGDVMQTHCEWVNDTSSSLTFPDEMCVGFGFFLTGSATAPVCLGGAWRE